MIHQVFTIYDSKASAYLPPFIMHKNEMALRLFTDCCNDKEHQFGKNAQDYTLFNIGEFDDNRGDVTKGLPNPLANGLELIRNELDTDIKQPDLKEVQ